MAARRKRSENFTFNDKKNLLERIESRKYIVENKRTDKLTVHAKEVAWAQITEEYNSIAFTPRTAETLRSCWDNLKKRFKNAIVNKRSDVKPGLVTEYEIFLSNKIRDILASTQDKFQSLSGNNASNSEASAVDDKDLEDSQSCSSDDSLHSETLLKEYSERWSRLKRIEDLERIENMENETSHKTKTDTPCVLMLTSHDLNSDSQAQDENNSKTFEFSHQRLKNGVHIETDNHQKIDRSASREQCQKMKNMSYALAEAKLELAVLAKEHALAEEKRKTELHVLQIQEAKLKIELMKLQLLNKKSQLFN